MSTRDGFRGLPFFVIGNSFEACHEELTAEPHIELVKGLLRLFFVARMTTLTM